MHTLNQQSFIPRIVFKVKQAIQLQGETEQDITRQFRDSMSLSWKLLFTIGSGIRIKRLFCTLQPSEIAPLIEKAKSINPTYQDPGLLSYFVLVAPNERTAQQALELLLGMEQVETAYRQGGSMPSPAAGKKKISLPGLATFIRRLKASMRYMPGHVPAAKERLLPGLLT